MRGLGNLFESIGFNFAVILLLLLLLTGAMWLIDHYWLRKRRPAGAAEPWWVEYPKSFFPVILIVFLLRSFLVEPFKIPSGSMLPTLLVGDFILVNKFTYGIRLPIINVKVVELNGPTRGDVMVFRYPENPSVDYIKRVIGVPGDKISYRNKQLWINGEEVKARSNGRYIDEANSVLAERLTETIGERGHQILIQTEIPSVHLSGVRLFPFRENCAYNESGFSCTVPPGHYFLMGDNRDSSSDSRYWGFVPESHIVGKAFLIWWNFDNLTRIGERIN
jgi:signal peptidase I